MTRLNIKIQQKYLVCTATCISLLLLYGSRFALSTVIPYLIHSPMPTPLSSENSHLCRSEGSGNDTTQEMVASEYLTWSQTERLLVLSSFYVGYAMFTCISGVFSDRLGGKYLLSIGIVGSSVITAATPYMLTKPPWYGAAAMQFLLGMTQGISAPAIMSLLAHWIPRDYHTLLAPYGYSGGCLGGMVSGVLSTYFTRVLDKWKIIFYLWSALLMAWFCVIIIFIYSRPTTHPYVSKKEKIVMIKEMGSELPTTIPWKNILQDSAVWALVVGQCADSFLKFTWYSYLPLFFKEVHGFKIYENTYAYIIAFGVQWLITIGTSILSNFLIKRRYVPLIYMRCICASVGNILPNILMVLSTLGCSRAFALPMITLAIAVKGTTFVALKPNILDITRHYAGVIQGFHNTLPVIVGIFIPYLIGTICKEFTLEAWKQASWLSTTFCTSTTVFYLIYCSGERAYWDIIEGEEVIQDTVYDNWSFN